MKNRFFDQRDGFKNTGFTLLELMIAITIFGFLMLYVSQLMRSEIRLYNNASKQNDLDHNARSAMMHILDEMRLVPNKTYSYGDKPRDSTTKKGYNSGVYIYSSTSTNYCLINENPPIDSLTGKLSPPDGTVIFFDKQNHKLWYRDGNRNDHLISDQIKSLILTQDEINPRLVKIVLIAEDTSINRTYELVSYMRLY
ncbi:PilW family protein [Desulfosporosinus nitroreducens]|uniref:PilW family protein n=1 Tax=Desulfosporosinus nitroreducens TaxID=2018668 RepID=UPI00207C82D8|nr:prepilin-type N-terminal cleavage/methylation domain-containing protein [Desulfosporosinus nitroreducens]MCO1600092.1 prepilin-type N-terminal cleavage/methylation domain-containing protein [Desulfosporosinus nitroreducens]